MKFLTNTPAGNLFALRHKVILICLISIQAIAISASARETSYLQQMPSISELENEIKGATEPETKAKRFVAARYLEDLIIGRSNSPYDHTPEEQKLIDQYENYAQSFLELHNGEVPAYYKEFLKFKNQYETDDSFKKEIENKFLSEEFIEQYHEDVSSADERDAKALEVKKANGLIADNLIPWPGFIVLMLTVFYIVYMFRKSSLKTEIYSWLKWNHETEEGEIRIGGKKFKIHALTGILEDEKNKTTISGSGYNIYSHLVLNLFLRDKKGDLHSVKVENPQLETTYMNVLSIVRIQPVRNNRWWDFAIINWSIRKQFFQVNNLHWIFKIGAEHKIFYFLCWIVIIAVAIFPPLFCPFINFPLTSSEKTPLGATPEESLAVYENIKMLTSGVRIFCLIIAVVLIALGAKLFGLKFSKAKKLIDEFHMPEGSI